jgi:acetyl esterase/lipase
VYEPAESNGHALLFIAGSGWHWPMNYGAGGIKDAVASRVLGGGSVDVLAGAGFTVFVINHRQAPLFRYPAAVEDARRAVRYIRHHGDEYGVTEEAIAAFGISSGAHLVLMLALGDGPGDPESADEVERHSSKIDVVAAFAGPTDLTAEEWMETVGPAYMTSFIGAPHDGLSGGAHAEASPLTYVDGDDPPVLLVHGDADQAVPVGQARTLAARLREHQVEVEYVEIAGGRHDFDAVLNHDPNELPSFPAMARWLLEHLPDADWRIARGGRGSRSPSPGHQTNSSGIGVHAGARAPVMKSGRQGPLPPERGREGVVLSSSALLR